MQAAPKKEILGIDLLRFAAALLVVMFHFGFWKFYAAPYAFANILRSSDIGSLLAPWSYFGWVGVEIFFVISGFVIAYSAEKATAFSFFRSRFVRLMPGVWIASVISIPAAFIENGGGGWNVAKLFVKSIVLYPHAEWIDRVLWTLPVEISFYCVVGILIARGMFKWLGGIISVIGLYSAAYWYVFAYLTHDKIFSPLWKELSDFSWSVAAQLSLVHYGCFFAVGVYLWMVLIKKKYGAYLFCLPVIMGGCILEMIYLNDTKIFDTDILQPWGVPVALWLLALLAIILSVVCNDRLLRKYTRHAKRIRWLGLLTYPLYLLHAPVGVAILYVASRAHLGPRLSWLGALFGAFAVSALVTSYAEPWLQGHTRSVINKINAIFQRKNALKPLPQNDRIS